ADALTIGVGDLQAGITHCLEAGGQAVLDEQVELARLLGGQVFLDVEALDRTAETGRIGRDVHMLKRTDAAAASQNTFPAARHIATRRENRTRPGVTDQSMQPRFVLLFPNGITTSGRCGHPPANLREGGRSASAARKSRSPVRLCGFSRLESVRLLIARGQ